MNDTEPTCTPVRVVIVDDQPLIRHSLTQIINAEADLTVVGEADNGPDAVTMVHETQPDVVLMDIRMPQLNGIEATRLITADYATPNVRVLVLSMFELDEYVHGALRAGASGFLLKDARPAQLIDAIRRTHSGESLFAPTILTRLIEHYASSRPAPSTSRVGKLTERETQVLVLIAQGLSNNEIAKNLVISIKTVKSHIGNLISKLSARDRAQLVIAAYEAGLVRSEPQGQDRTPP